MNAFERVTRWRREWLASNAPHWGDKIDWSSAEELARRLDEPLGLDSAPRDGSLFDLQVNGLPYLDCRFTSHGRLVQEHGYPAMTRYFFMDKAHEYLWTPRPADRVQPYSKNAKGERYIP